MKTPIPSISNTVATIDAKRPDKEVLVHAALILANGGLVVAPTETRYGLIVNADNDMALNQMFLAKQRPEEMPSAVFCDSLDRCWEYAVQNKNAIALAREFLPGPLTLILKARKNWNRFITPDKRIGIRYSSSPVISALLQKVSFPLTATSANISGDEESDSIGRIHAALGSAVSLYLDAGILAGEASTVVDCTEGCVRVLRQGFVSEKDILRVIKAKLHE